jgi:aryl-alcohol dehydrogenase-like predicted oxidoreductase
VGARSASQAEGVMGAAELRLSPDEIEKIEEEARKAAA